MMAPDPNQILNDCCQIDQALDGIDEKLNRLRRAHQRIITQADSSTAEIDALNSEINVEYRGLVNRVRKIKGLPESGSPRNAPQVGRVDRRLRKIMNDHQQVESEFRRQLRDRTEREYRIVKPDATDEEIRAVVEDPNQPIFSQAIMQSDRLGTARETMGNVRARHAEIQKIEKQMIELAQLFEDLNAIVVEQEPMVMNIEQKGEEVHENVVKANTEIGGAIEKARSRNKKKWWCLGITILIIIIIIIIAVVVVELNKQK